MWDVGRRMRGRLFSSDSRWFLPLGLVLLGVVAYANSFRGVFMLDDHSSIVENPDIGDFGEMVRNSTRPLTQATFHLNYVVGGLRPAGYHAVNLVIHLVAGLALYGLVRQTLGARGGVGRSREEQGVAGKSRGEEGGAGRSRGKKGRAEGSRAVGAELSAFAVAAIWLVHPLQTASVTYIVQRAETLMGMFYLLTLYCAARGMYAAEARRSPERSRDLERGGPPPYRAGWHGAAVTACALGMLSKPVMVTAPVAVLLYDRAYASGGFLAALRRRRYLYAGLGATWLVLAALLLSPHESSYSAGVTAGLMSPAGYLATQAGVVLHYLRTVFVPTQACFDYAWPVVGSWRETVLPGSVPALLLAAAVWAFVRGRALGFPAVFFFLALVPSSSFIPVADCAFDHRMYLPLAGVVAVVVPGAYGLLSSRRQAGFSIAAVVLGCLLIGTLIIMTIDRNRDYHDEERMWRDVVSKRPGNLRAHEWLIAAMMDRGDYEEAEEAAARLVRVVESLETMPGDRSRKYHLTMALDRLGRILAARGKMDEAVGAYRRAIEADPRNRVAHCNLAVALFLLGKPGDALATCEAAIAIDGDYAKAHSMKGLVLRSRGRFRESVDAYRRALECPGDVLHARHGLAWLLAACPETDLCDGGEAVRLATEVSDATGGRSVGGLDLLAAAYARARRFEDAVRTAERALALASVRGAGGDDGMGYVPRDGGPEGIRSRLELYRVGRPFTDRTVSADGEGPERD